MAGKLKSYRELTVWQKSRHLCLDIYRITRSFPKEEKYVLNSQLRRASISVVSNIAEGWGRKTTQQYIYALYLAYGSLCELETQLLICHDLGYLKTEEHRKLQKSADATARMLRNLIKSLESLDKKRAP